MEKIYQHIEKLLAQHDYVVVPNLGGFVAQTNSAILFPDRITPPQSTIGFNPLMHHSDGLLAIEIARTEGISYRTAIELIDSEIENVRKNLNDSKQFEFGNLGFLNLNESGNILFSPKQKAEFLPVNFGISDIYTSEIIKHKNKELKKITFSLPSKQVFKYAAAGALVFGLLFISPNVNDMRRTNKADFSSLIPLQFPQTTVVQDSTKNDSTSISLEEITVNDSCNFHVIVASLPTESSADKYCKILAEGHYAQAHVLPPSKIYRVAIQSFSNREKAIEYMENLRLSDDQFETAWVLCEN
ncbi:MAG: SPOR domain-containing protein [Paludibacter sp.]